MKAMIFAAGRGERMGALTKATPKPLLQVGGKPLIEYTLARLSAAGIKDVIINISYLGEQIRGCLGSGDHFGLTIHYSAEDYPLETGGGILHALPLLGEEPFLIVNADVWTDYPLDSLIQRGLARDELGHLVLVPNPAHNPSGDFLLTNQQLLVAAERSTGETVNHPASTLYPGAQTYSGMALLHPKLVADYPQRRDKFPLLEAFLEAISQGRLTGEFYAGEWRDIGTAERLSELNVELSARS